MRSKLKIYATAFQLYVKQLEITSLLKKREEKSNINIRNPLLFLSKEHVTNNVVNQYVNDT